MNRKLLTGVYTAASLLVGMSSAAPALADGRDAAASGVGAQFFTFGQLLGFGGNSMDVWRINCPLPTTNVTADVLDRTSINNPAAALKVTIFKDFFPPSSAFDFVEGFPVGGTAGLIRDSGVYHIAFRKTSTGVDDYDSIFNCRNGNLIVAPIGVPNKVVDE